MNEKVIINNQKEQGYTAKAAMKLVVEHMKAKTAQAISVITLEDNQDAECILFVKMFLRFLHKNRGRVLLLAENPAMADKLEEHIAESNARIRIVERATIEEHGVSDDMILNRINGAEAECIIASLPAEMEERFLEKNRTALDAKIWFSIGTHLKQKKKPTKLQLLWEGILQHFTKKEI